MGGGENTLHDLSVAANAFEGVQVHKSQWSGVLADSAEENSKLCARFGRGGHHQWTKRFNALVDTGIAHTFAEINAESWKSQENNNPVQLWTEAFKCWRQSPGHWSVASVTHKMFGASLARSKGGIWYMTIVVADGGDPVPVENKDYRLW